MPVVKPVEKNIMHTCCLWRGLSTSIRSVGSLLLQRVSICLLLVAIAFTASPVTGFAQGKNSTKKLYLAKSKSERSQRKKQRESSKFVGNGVPVAKNSGSRMGNPADAKAYRQVGLPPRSRNPLGEQIARSSQAYRGNGQVESFFLKEKRARKASRKMSGYRGDILVKSPKGIRNKSQQMSRYRGDILVKKMPKGAHPSAVYRGGKVKNSYQQKERYRKRMMKRIGRNRESQQPNYLRRRNREERPTYDSRESEIWNKPR